MSAALIRVLCVDDHAFLAEGLRSKISLEPDMVFVGWLPDASSLVKEARTLHADVVTVDLEMPGPDPFEAIDDLRRVSPGTKAIVLSAHVRDRYLDAAVAAGAWGYLSKSDDPDAIVAAVRKVMLGRFALGPSLEGRSLLLPEKQRKRTARPVSRSTLLTTREEQILRMIGRGMARHEIATTLHRSAKTIDTHQQSIMRKLGLHDRVELVRYAIREGFVEP